MKKEYIVTFWTEPTKYNSGRIEKRVFKANSRYEAGMDAEDRFPRWSVIDVQEAEDEEMVQG